MRYQQELALCFVTMIWGATFLVIRMAMEACGPLFFVGLRFGSAALILLALSWPLLAQITRRELLGGVLLGCIVFLGFALQTAGLASLDAAKSAFLTAFYVPLVPLIEWLLMKRRPSGRSFVSLSLAFVGVILLSGGFNINLEGSRGEMLTLLCSLLFALEIVCTGMVAPGSNTRRLALVELTVTALLSFALMPVTGEGLPEFSWFVVLSACGLGYRVPYVREAALKAASGSLKGFDELSTEELIEALMELKGVGIKVASCVALFGYHRLEVAPVDVWMKRVIDGVYGGSLPEEYKDCAGVIQQYLFNYARITRLGA